MIFKGKTILVTGGTGSMGSTLVRRVLSGEVGTPKKVMAYAEFMSRTGMIPVKAESWKDLFFEEVHNLPGS